MATYTNNHSGTFVSCNNYVKQHILNAYLLAKIKNYTGFREDDLRQCRKRINVPAHYDPEEGAISRLQAGFPRGLRVDLQTAQTIRGVKYACWQVQFGSGHGRTADGGAYAGVLMRTDTAFTFPEFCEAMKKSFEYTPPSYCRLDP